MNYCKPKRIFEKSGSVNPEESYYVSLDSVVNSDGRDIKSMVDLGRYFSIFAPRQSGKTTFLNRFCESLENDRTYVPIFLSFEMFSNLPAETFYAQIQKSLYHQLIERLTLLDCEKLEDIKAFLLGHPLNNHVALGDLLEELNRRIRFTKIIIFIDNLYEKAKLYKETFVDRYIARIGVIAFYNEKKPYEKTGQFLLTAWLYQFVKGGGDEVHYELHSGLGRIDVLLAFRGYKYIIETKVNRLNDISGTINEGIAQLAGKYLATENSGLGYLIVFDVNTPAGKACEIKLLQSGDKQVMVFIIAIGKVNNGV